ncbi:putative transcription factor WRKY family [Helianthus anomalus]
MESLVENRLYGDVLHLNSHKISTLTPELQFPPFLAKSFLQEKNSLIIRPPSVFQHTIVGPVLRLLDLSHTCIQSLPPSISRLRSLERFILRDCSLLIELPPEVGALKNLKLFDLEGTEIMYLPKEIGKLETLERLRVSLSAYADDHKDRHGIQHIIPRMTILKLTKLKELSISVSPEAEWWEVELLEAIMGDLCFLPDLETLKLYLPTAKALQQFLRLERYKVPIYSSLWNYRFMTGHCEELPFSVQLDTEENFLKLEKCVKYMNGEGTTDEIVELIRDARALYLRRHWTIKKLSVFDIRKLKYCLLMECNEMVTLVDQEDFYGDKNKSTSHNEDDETLGSLQYLSINFMKKLQRISKGPIGGISLSCLTILALHTCPELASIFTECLLDNLQSLTEIIVEDCPKVNCLVNLEEGAPRSNGPFLPSLRRISLIDLPELVSVSGGVSIAPQLDTLLVFNCMKLDYLSDTEIPRDTLAIKGEIEWWDALKYGKLTWESVFVQLKRDGSLMDQLAEETNSLQRFLELQIVPSVPGQVHQNSSTDTKEDMEYVDWLQIDHNADLSDETRKWSNQEPSDDGYIWRKHIQNKSLDSSFSRKHGGFHIAKAKHKMEVSKRIIVAEDLNDGYSWRKYGQKEILGSKYPRGYYRCTYRRTHACLATKQIQRCDQDGNVFEVSYRGKHTCHTVLSNNCSSTATESASTNTDSYFEIAKRPQLVDVNQIKSIITRDAKKIQQLKVRVSDLSTESESASVITDGHFEFAQSPQMSESNHSSITTSKSQLKIKVEGTTEDGYSWRKYGEKDILDSKYPRVYYRCSFKNTSGCRALKQVQRITEDPPVFEVCYMGEHTCHTDLLSSCSTITTESSYPTFGEILDEPNAHKDLYEGFPHAGSTCGKTPAEPDAYQDEYEYKDLYEGFSYAGSTCGKTPAEPDTFQDEYEYECFPYVRIEGSPWYNNFF